MVSDEHVRGWGTYREASGLWLRLVWLHSLCAGGQWSSAPRTAPGTLLASNNHAWMQHPASEDACGRLNSQQLSILSPVSLESVVWSLVLPLTDDETEAPNHGSGSPVSHCVRFGARLAVSAFFCCFNCPLCWMWGWLPSLVSLLGLLHLSALWECRPQRGKRSLCLGCFCCDNTSHNAALIAGIISMAGLAHGYTQGSSPINLFFSD